MKLLASASLWLAFFLVFSFMAQSFGQGAKGTAPAAKQAKDYDVVVIGGTPAGVAAAIAAARADKTVIIIEQAPCLGGVLSSGVLRLDDKYVEANSGVMDEFRLRVQAYHRTEMANDPLVKQHMKQNPPLRWNIAAGLGNRIQRPEFMLK